MKIKIRKIKKGVGELVFKKLIFVLIIVVFFFGFKIVVVVENGSRDLVLNEVIVINFIELKIVIFEDNGIDIVYLGVDVELLGGIIILVMKKIFILLGKNLVIGEIYILIEIMVLVGV